MLCSSRAILRVSPLSCSISAQWDALRGRRERGKENCLSFSALLPFLIMGKNGREERRERVLWFDRALCYTEYVASNRFLLLRRQEHIHQLVLRSRIKADA